MHCLRYPILCTYSMIESFLRKNSSAASNFPLCSLSEELERFLARFLRHGATTIESDRGEENENATRRDDTNDHDRHPRVAKLKSQPSFFFIFLIFFFFVFDIVAYGYYECKFRGCIERFTLFIFAFEHT